MVRGPGFEPGQAFASGFLVPDLESAPFNLARAPPRRSEKLLGGIYGILCLGGTMFVLRGFSRGLLVGLFIVERQGG